MKYDISLRLCVYRLIITMLIRWKRNYNVLHCLLDEPLASYIICCEEKPFVLQMIMFCTLLFDNTQSKYGLLKFSPIVYCDESVLLALAIPIEKTLKVEVKNLNIMKGSFVKVYTDIDLTILVIEKFSLKRIWYNTKYEGLIFCA